MKNSIYFKQSKPLTVKMLGAIILVLVFFFIYDGIAPLNQIVVMSIIGILLIGYSFSYEFRNDYNNKKHFQLFGISFFKFKLEVFFPDYISVFSASFKKGSDWGPVAALGNDNKEKSYVVRLFKGNKHFTVCQGNSLTVAKAQASKLSNLLKVKTIVKD